MLFAAEQAPVKELAVAEWVVSQIEVSHKVLAGVVPSQVLQLVADRDLEMLVVAV